MHSRIAIVVALALVVGVACSPPTLEHEGPAGPGVVGDSCAVSSDCNLDLGCIDQAPEGFCSKECSADDPCPDGSLCIEIEIEGSNLYGCFVACSPDAQEDDERSCRPDYDCRPVGDSPLHICYW